MAKGGKRSNAGRKPGSKDAKPRTRRHQLTTIQRKDKKALKEYEESTKPLYLHIEKYLTSKNKKLYKELLPSYGSALECIRAVRDDLMVRYNFARIAEIEGVSEAKRVAKTALEEIKKHGTLGGKALDEKKKATAINKFTTQLKTTYPKLSSQVTTLATELRQINELIDRIESNRQDLTLNIFNILSQKPNKKTIALRDRLFTLTPEEKDAAEDAEFKEE